jgi:acyl-coenzyme A synthetase/AMP-(fatty) acid ligase
MAEVKVEQPKAETKKGQIVRLISVCPTQGITLQGSELPKAIVNGKVVFGARVSGKRVAFVDNEADVPAEWMEYTSETTGLPAGIRHTEGYRNEFVEKELLVKGVKEKQPWAMSFFSRMNTKRMIVTPALGEMDKMDLLGIKPD